MNSQKSASSSDKTKSPKNSGRLQLVQKFTNLLKNLEGNLEAQNSMLKKIHTTSKVSQCASLESSMIDKTEIANAFISFFGSEASVCLNDYFTFLEEEKKQKKNLEDTIKDLSNMEILLKQAKFQLFTTFHLHSKTPGREEPSNLKLNDPRTARFLIPTEFSSNYGGESSPDSSFRKAFQGSPFPTNKSTLSPVSRRDSRPLEDCLDVLPSSEKREEKKRLKDKIQGFQELFNKINSKEGSPLRESRNLKASYCDDIIDQAFQTVRTTEEEEINSKKNLELNDTLSEQDFCFLNNYDNLNESCKGSVLEEIREESRTSLECSNSTLESVFNKESVASNDSNKDNSGIGKRTTFLKEQKVRGNLKEILNSENLIVEFKSAEKRSILQKYEEKAKFSNSKSMCSKKSSSSKKSQDFNYEFFDINASSKDLRESIDSQIFDGVSLKQSKYIQKISNFDIMQQIRKTGSGLIPNDAMKRKKQNDENLFLMPKVLDDSRQSWLSSSETNSVQKNSGQKSQWFDIESKLESIIDSKGSSFISPKSSMAKEPINKLSSSQVHHFKERKSDLGVFGKSVAAPTFQPPKRSNLDVLEHSISFKLSNLRK